MSDVDVGRFVFVLSSLDGHGREREVGDTQDFFVNPIKCKIFL
jgi:hypothetical protein